MIKMARISLDNGHTYMTAQEATPEIDEHGICDAIVNMMDDDTREAVHAAVAPCSNAEFLAAYLANADYDLIIG